MGCYGCNEIPEFLLCTRYERALPLFPFLLALMGGWMDFLEGHKHGCIVSDYRGVWSGFGFHLRTEWTGLPNICFAFDLMLLTKGDRVSGTMLKGCLEEFSNLSELGVRYFLQGSEKQVG